MLNKIVKDVAVIIMIVFIRKRAIEVTFYCTVKQVSLFWYISDALTADFGIFSHPQSHCLRKAN